MKRKITVLTLCALLFALCAIAEAQQPKKVPRIGYLIAGTGTAFSHSPSTDAFRQGLHDLGWTDGKNITIDYRWSEGKAERLPALAAELAALHPDVIFTGSPQAVFAAKKATATIPIVFVGIGDPVGMGVVSSLARPGGNITGLSNFSPELSGKRLELLKETFPKISSVAVLWNGASPGHPLVLKQMEAAASLLGLKLQPVEVRSAGEFDGALEAVLGARVQAFVPLGDPLMGAQRRRIVDFAAQYRLPAIYAAAEYAESGGLMSYGPDFTDQHRRAATYVDKILKGAKPADLPVEQPKKFEFVINLKTAKQIGLTIPPNVLARADTVIR
jgi:ABC-type uncharacterized transport system substrate-binding protein